jgi:hypothetical protein
LTPDSEHLIRERFSVLVNRNDDADWNAVRRRARRGLRRSRLLALAVLAAVAVAIAAPALGLSGKIVHLFGSSEPAPARVEESFASLDVGAPAGMAPGVIAEQTRKVLDQPIGDEWRAVLWIAPTKAGGFCMTLGLGRVDSAPHELGGGCDRDRALPFSLGLGSPGPISRTGKILRGPVLFSGSVLSDEGSAVAFDFEDGRQATVPVVWVSEPIDAGFFVYAVPEEHWGEGHRPTTAMLEDEEGTVLAREHVHWFQFQLPPKRRFRK